MNSIKAYHDQLAKQGGKTHWEINSENRVDPGHESLRNAAHDAAKKKTKDITDAALDHLHPDHEKALKDFVKYPGGQLQQHCIGEAMDKLGIKPIENRNEAYERQAADGYNIVKGGSKTRLKYRAANPVDRVTLDKFRDTLKAKHYSQGYKNDAEDIAQFWAKNNLSQFTAQYPAPDGTVSPAIIY